MNGIIYGICLSDNSSIKKSFHMKKSIAFFIFFVLSVAICHCQEDAYYYITGGKVQNIVINNNQALVYFDKNKITTDGIKNRYNFIREVALSGEKSERLLAVNISICKDSINSLKGCDYVADIEPVVGLQSPVPVSNIFYVKLRSLEDFQRLQEEANVAGVNITGQIPYLPLWYSLETNKYSIGNALEMSNYFYETGLFEDVDPGFVYTVFYNTLNCTSDIELGTQWGLDAINACDAWQTTKGNSNIRVALLDRGLDEGHLDKGGAS